MSSLPGDDSYIKKGMSDSRPSTPRELIATASLTNSLTDSMASIKYDGPPDNHRYSNNIDKERASISFTPVERPNIGGDTFGDDFTSSALKSCKRTVLGPYHVFLKIIGWRRLSPSQEMTSPLHYKVFNIAWPIILTLLLIVSCVTQIMLCFTRDSIQIAPPNATMMHFQCKEDHIVSTYILLDILLICAYLYGVYIFRIKEPEHLSTFTETVFLGIISRRGIYSPRYLIKSLQFLMFLGLFWILFSMGTSVLRLFAHHYFRIKSTVTYALIPINDTNAQQWVVGSVSIVSILGFIVFDVAYTAVVINYSIQCQLMVYYLQSISTRIVDREWEIEQSIKEVHSARQFLSKLNSHMSKVTGVMMFIFLTSSFNAVYGLEELRKDNWDSHIHIIVATTFLSIIQWVTWLFLPLIQAARVTRGGTWLLKTALQMRARPLTYRDTPQLDLDSFLLYCSNVQMKAKLFSISISPGIVLGGAFILGFVFYLVFNLPNDSFSWARWL